ncbi:ribonuclease HII [Pseudaminobacter sp. 19-2017]|uniref:Ribonuclease HII n=1 Tax=Pseudaminobacter soli (ex Zhang et al. 2022) TaxID=2831468 RepID=A0A942DWV8_9HYPH|nr:ribonuclease HII [Pseudaminobacter soli]MBS3648307.1 ribonuclease HII [Pseudaminobacter soli]
MPRSFSDSPPLFELTFRPDFSYEKKAMKRGLWPLAGLDEAGRGPLAGPVVAAAVILNPKKIPDGLDDSKRLTAERRDELFAEILKKASAVSVSSVSAGGIDRINILRASLEAMRRALCGLAIRPLHALIDGRDVPPGLTCGAEALVKGDQRSQSIAAASIVAKVMRDRMMHNCGRSHVHYGFESHMGYATQRHRSAIDLHGAVPRIHRTSFSPFRIDGEVVVEETIELLVDA